MWLMETQADVNSEILRDCVWCCMDPSDGDSVCRFWGWKAEWTMYPSFSPIRVLVTSLIVSC